MWIACCLFLESVFVLQLAKLLFQLSGQDGQCQDLLLKQVEWSPGIFKPNKKPWESEAMKLKKAASVINCAPFEGKSFLLIMNLN